MSDAPGDVESAPPWADGAELPTPRGYAWDRLEEQLDWYDHKSGHHKDWFQRLKVLQIVVAAAIPVAAGTGAKAWITGWARLSWSWRDSSNSPVPTELGGLPSDRRVPETREVLEPLARRPLCRFAATRRRTR
jgi:hypothetical protein